MSRLVQNLATAVRASHFLLDILALDGLAAAETVVVYHVILLAHRLSQKI